MHTQTELKNAKKKNEARCVGSSSRQFKSRLLLARRAPRTAVEHEAAARRRVGHGGGGGAGGLGGAAQAAPPSVGGAGEHAHHSPRHEAAKGALHLPMVGGRGGWAGSTGRVFKNETPKWRPPCTVLQRVAVEGSKPWRRPSRGERRCRWGRSSRPGVWRRRASLRGPTWFSGHRQCRKREQVVKR